MQIDDSELNRLINQMVGDLGAAVNGALVILGDRLGLYKALASAGPMDSHSFADQAGISERYAREWLAAQAASGYLNYDPATDCFSMSPEQRAVFADEDSPALMTGGFYSVGSVYADEAKLAQAYRSGEGIKWGDHHQCLFCGVERFFRPGYQANLVHEWLPKLDGVLDKLHAGAKVADVGCGHGASTLILAQAFPQSEFIGYDIHAPSIEHARHHAAQAGLDNIRFEVASAQDFPGQNYDLIGCFDCLHDMGDPVGAAKHIHQALAKQGSWMIIEPFAHNDLASNLTAVGRVYYGFSAAVCVPTALSQPVGMALGAQAGEARLREVARQGGFSHFRKATETPFNLILQAQR